MHVAGWEEAAIPFQYDLFIYDYFLSRGVLSAPKSIQATVTLLENLHIVLEKSVTEEMRLDILPLLFTSFDSNTIQVQVTITLRSKKISWNFVFWKYLEL